MLQIVGNQAETHKVAESNQSQDSRQKQTTNWRLVSDFNKEKESSPGQMQLSSIINNSDFYEVKYYTPNDSN